MLHHVKTMSINPVLRRTQTLPSIGRPFTPKRRTQTDPSPPSPSPARTPASTTAADDMSTPRAQPVAIGAITEPITVGDVEGGFLRVIPISDDAIPEWDDSRCLPAGEVGEFAVRGPVVTAEYFGRPEATRLAKIRDPKTGDLWHRMGDVGYYDGSGRLWFCGRKSHRVVTPAGTLYTDQVEPVFNTVEGVYRTALVGVRRGGVTHPVLCVELMAQPRTYHEEPRVEADLRTRGAGFEHTRRVATFLFHPGFPVDVRHNSKIFRERLAAWADRELGPAWRPSA